MKWYVILIDALVGLPLLTFFIWAYVVDEISRLLINALFILAAALGLVVGLAALNGLK